MATTTTTRTSSYLLVCAILCCECVAATAAADGDQGEREDGVPLDRSAVQALCDAQCTANCNWEKVNITDDCDCQTTAFLWAQNCNTTSCAKNCMHGTEAEAHHLPDIPSLHLTKRSSQSVSLSWEPVPSVSTSSNSSDHPFPVYYVLHAYKKIANADAGLWMVFNQTSDTSFVAERLDVCASYQFQVAAISPYGTRGFSRLTNVTEPAVVEDCRINRIYYEDELIKVNVSCKPSDWDGSIDGYQVHVVNRKCTNKVVTDATVFVYPGPGPLNATIKLSKENFGCEFGLRIEGYSGCLYSDLRECSKIENYNCKPKTSVRTSLPAVTNVSISHPWKTKEGNISVNVSWAAVDSSVYFHGYGVEWGHRLMSSSFFPMIKSGTAQQVYIPKEENSFILQNLLPNTNYVVKIGVQGAPNQDIIFGMLLPYVFYTSMDLFGETTTSQYETSTHNSTSSVQGSPKAYVISANISTMMDQKITITGLQGDETEPEDDRKHKLNAVMLALYISLPLLCVTVIVILIYVYFRYQRLYSTKNHIAEDKEEGIPNIYISPKLYRRPQPDPHDRWEVSHSRITFGEILGQGAFGQVIKGRIEGRILTHQNSQSSLVKESVRSQDVAVAVKMLHEHAEDSQKQEFLREIDLMKDIGHHSNVVSIIACCTMQEPLCLIVEHCEQGDLLNYLRKRRSEIDSDNVAAGNDIESLTPSDLLSFARQIAIGMEFLSQKGFVHRDLAARNVLVADHKTVKIGDFGLTRYIYDDKIYHNKKGGKLPIKWMSVEAIFDQLFTTNSDVWSFGVVLFELVTLGGSPYPGISNHCVVQLLKRGYRMEKPDNCSHNLYDIMLWCWREKPRERPTFTELRHFLESLLEQDTPYLDFNLDKSKDYYKFSADASSGTASEGAPSETDSVALNPNAWRFTVSSCSSSGSSRSNSSSSSGRNDSGSGCSGVDSFQQPVSSSPDPDDSDTTQYSNRGPQECDPLMDSRPERKSETDRGDRSQHQRIFIESGDHMKLKEYYIRKDFHRLAETVV